MSIAIIKGHSDHAWASKSRYYSQHVMAKCYQLEGGDSMYAEMISSEFDDLSGEIGVCSRGNIPEFNGSCVWGAYPFYPGDCNLGKFPSHP